MLSVVFRHLNDMLNLLSRTKILKSPRKTMWDEAIHTKQISILIKQIPGVLVAPNIGAIILIILLWGNVPQATLLSWLAATLIATGVLPAIILWRYNNDANREYHTTYWSNLLFKLAFISGSTWGMAGYFLFTPDSIEHQMILYLFIYAGASIVMTTMVANRREFYAVVVTMLLPIAFRSAEVGDLFHICMTIITLVLLGIIIFFHHTAHNSLIESLILQYENLELAQDNARKTLQAEQANREKSRFLAAASHDLRQPLHAQVLFAAELRSRLKDEKSLEILGYLENSMETMKDLFDALLDISKLDSGMITPVIRNFNIMDLLSSLEAEYSPQAEKKGIKLRVVACHSVISSDPVLLENILRNIICNAIRNTLTGSVMICCRKSSQHLKIQVRDSGIGIPEDKHRYIFEEFSQLGNPERDREKGLGLGLPIVDRLSKLLHHPLHLKSQPDSGTIFTVEVPVSSHPVTVNQDKNTVSNTQTELSDLNVLIIDDDSTILQAMQGLLTNWGCIIITASSETEAVSKINERNFKPDIIITDYRLRENTTGVNAIKLIQDKLNEYIPAILITGDTAPERLQEANSSGYQLLHKPVDPGKLQDLLSMLKPAKASL